MTARPPAVVDLGTAAPKPPAYTVVDPGEERHRVARFVREYGRPPRPRHLLRLATSLRARVPGLAGASQRELETWAAAIEEDRKGPVYRVEQHAIAHRDLGGWTVEPDVEQATCEAVAWTVWQWCMSDSTAPANALVIVRRFDEERGLATYSCEVATVRLA